MLAEHGYTLSPDAYERFYNDGIDGIEHDEHSQSRDHYVAWQRERTLAMLAETDVHPGEYEAILEQLRTGAATRVIEAYDEVPEVLADLRTRGLRIVICSNWDWDLREAVDEAGLTDAVDAIVSSAWVGARKPHPRIYAQTLREAGVEAGEAPVRRRHLGPRRRGPARRRDHRRSTCAATATGPTAPARTTTVATAGVPVIADLRGPARPLGSSRTRSLSDMTRSVRDPTPPRSPPTCVKRLRATFDVGRTRPVEWRKAQLHALKQLLVEGEAELLAALDARPRQVGARGLRHRDRDSCGPRSTVTLRHLDAWLRPAQGARPGEAAAGQGPHPPRPARRRAHHRSVELPGAARARTARRRARGRQLRRC